MVGAGVLAATVVATSALPATAPVGAASATASDQAPPSLHGDHLVVPLDGSSASASIGVPQPGAVDLATPASTPFPTAGGEIGSSIEGFLPTPVVSGFVGGRILRLREHPNIEALRPIAEGVAAEVAAITGAPFSVASGTTSATSPADGEVLIQISDTSPCGSGVAGCGQVNTVDGQGVRGTVWILTSSLGYSTELLEALVRHELGHTLGLAHYVPDHLGQPQVMYPVLQASPFMAGDTNGLRLLAPGCDAVFPDAPADHQFCDQISWTQRNGLLGGYADGSFGTTRPVSRQALAALLHRYAGEPAPSVASGFTDVPPEHPFADAIAWLVETGIAGGYPDGTFRPGAAITRQAMAAFLHRYLLWRTATSAEDHPQSADFDDVPGGHPFEVPIETLASYGVLKGTPTWQPTTGIVTLFKPQDPVSRQAAAAFLFRFDSL